MRIQKRIEQLDKDRQELLALARDMLQTIALERNHSATVGQLNKELGWRWTRRYNIIEAIDPGEI